MDRAALDAALEFGISCGGWCPRGRRAEDGPIPARYPLKETASAQYRVRTRKNVEESDGTLILTDGSPSAGTALTRRLCRQLKKPFFAVRLPEADPNPVVGWALLHGIRTLNLAGPRESEAPGIHARALAFLRIVLSIQAAPPRPPDCQDLTLEPNSTPTHKTSGPAKKPNRRSGTRLS